jgi:CheY-like chemotaxis protein
MHVDTPSNRKFLQHMLQKKNIDSSMSAENGQAAVETVREQGNDAFDMIFMDYSMPVMVFSFFFSTE